ncbi:SitI3 family protein [Micromonospora sp. NPDC023956]|uniref:SitI3 family protein n=1 Tax=Micromonospora sp. NPDC023956 TaxID=3155722 RepID=UPI0033F2F743
MAIEYRLVLAGDITAEQLADHAFPDPTDRATFTPYANGLEGDLYDRYGFTVDVTVGRNGYVDVETDEGQWEWEPDPYARLNLRMNKETLTEQGIPHMLDVFARVLRTTTQDAALVANADYLLLLRRNGVVRKHRRGTWWDHYPFANSKIPG